MVGDGQRVTVPPIAELELGLEVGAPQIIGASARGQRRAARALALPIYTLALVLSHASDLARQPRRMDRR